MHKETVKTRPARVAAFKKDPEKKEITSSRAATPLSNASIFGSLKRGQGVAATPTPRSTQAATKSNDVRKTRALVQLRNKPPDKEKTPWFRTTNNNLARREPIKSSIASLNVNSVQTVQKSANATDLKKRRPISTPAAPANVTYRRGQNAKIDGQNLPDNLSRTSSVTNLDVEQKISKGAKPRKSASRDRIDKIGENKKNDKKGVTKNNNKLESGDSPYPSIDSLQEEEFVQLRRQLQEMAQEKSNLALQLGEQKGQLNILQSEIQKLKDESNIQLEHLTEENTVLRNRLRNVAHSPLSDNEKQQLLFETHRHHSSSAPASIATNLIEEGNGGDVTACPTPDWDKHSSGNVSEVSVACLQDKINQMQETHYSTNEELQATLQELTDLQRQLTELQQENERLNEEKTLMFDSLCRQTERLNDSRSEVESLKQLLYREKDETGQYESAVEREQKLVDLLKSAQEEREALIVKLEQVSGEAQEARAGIVEKDEHIAQLSNRVRTLESTLDAKHAEHKLIDQELAQAKDQCSGKQIEINRLTDLLDNARTKIGELEQDRELSDKSELDELLDNARKEKDALESEVAHLKEQLAISKNETEKLREQVSVLQEECKVTRNNARTKQSDLEYKCEKLLSEKNNLSDQLHEFQEAVNELQVQSQCQLEDKRQLSAVLSETQRNLSETERKNLSLENELEELKKLRAEENEEWEKFQNDLLTSVRVANDFKTEAQQELQRMIMENKSYRERERQLKAELEKLKGDKTKKGVSDSSNKPKSSETEKVSNTEMDGLLKFSRKSKDKPRKSKESAETSSSDSKPDKGKEKKPDLLKKLVKQRDKQVAKSRKIKTLSVEEELLLKSLNDWYENIDKNIPEENLTEEQKVVKKLKTLYEDDSLKERPIAHKPKNQLAISKPLLDSVFLNPKLEEIVNDPNMPTIEEMGNFEILSLGQEALELRTSPDKTDRAAKGRSEDFGKPNESETKTITIARSKSCDDLYNLEEAERSPNLYRSAETYDLRDVDLKPVQRESSILPSDSVSNPRYSDFTVVVYQVEKHKEPKAHTVGAKVARKSSVNFETLNRIVRSIPKDAPEHQLSSEQKFALRLKKSLDEAERKNTLKKLQKVKNLNISLPTIESVNRNDRLRDILLDPCIKPVQRRNSENLLDSVAPLSRESLRHSKSHEDIAFTFHIDPNKTTSRVSSNGSFSSAEFNVDSRVLRKSKGNKLVSLYNLKEDAKRVVKDENDSLVYNETLTRKQESRDFDLLYNETLNPAAQMGHNEELERRLVAYPREKVIGETEADDLGYFETINKNVSVGNKEITEDKKSAYYQPISETIQYSKADVIYDEYLNASVDKMEEVDNGDRHLNKEEIDYVDYGEIDGELVDTAVTPITYVCEGDASNVRLLKVEVKEANNNIDNVAIFKGYEETSSEYEVAEVDNEYDYHSILKENKYGVVSPLNIRLAYKDVVKEIKHKFPENYENVNKSEEGGDDDIEQRDAFFDDFFGIKPKEATSNVSVQAVADNTSDIDREMEEIFENYLHTPLSKVITQIDDNSVNVDLKNAQSYLNSTSANADVTDDANPSGNTLDEIVLIIDDKQTDKSKEEMSGGGKELAKDDVEQKLGQDKLKKTEEDASSGKDEDINTKVETNLTLEELDLVRSVKHDRFSRPLSDFNEDDLRRIQEISAHYIPEETTPQKQNEEPEKELEKNLEISKIHVDDLEKTTTSGYDENTYLKKVNLEENKQHDNLQLDEEIKGNDAEKRAIEIQPSVEGNVRTKVSGKGIQKEEARTQSNDDSDLDSMLKKIFAPKDILLKRSKNRRIKGSETNSVEATESKRSSDNTVAEGHFDDKAIDDDQGDLEQEEKKTKSVNDSGTTISSLTAIPKEEKQKHLNDATSKLFSAPKGIIQQGEESRSDSKIINDFATSVTNRITPTDVSKTSYEELDNGDEFHDAVSEVLPVPKEITQQREESSGDGKIVEDLDTSNEVFKIEDFDGEGFFSVATIEVLPAPEQVTLQREETRSDSKVTDALDATVMNRITLTDVAKANNVELDGGGDFHDAVSEVLPVPKEIIQQREESSSDNKIIEDLDTTVTAKIIPVTVLKTSNEVFKIEDFDGEGVFSVASIEVLPAPEQVTLQREETTDALDATVTITPTDVAKASNAELDGGGDFHDAVSEVLPVPRGIIQQREESRSDNKIVEDLDTTVTAKIIPVAVLKTSNEVFKIEDFDGEGVFSVATIEVLPVPEQVTLQREETTSDSKVTDALDATVTNRITPTDVSKASNEELGGVSEVLPVPKGIEQQGEESSSDNKIIEDLDTTVTDRISPTDVSKISKEELDGASEFCDTASEVIQEKIVQERKESSSDSKFVEDLNTTVFKVRDLDGEDVFSEATIEVLPAPKHITLQREESISDSKIDEAEELNSGGDLSNFGSELLPAPKQIAQQREKSSGDDMDTSLAKKIVSTNDLETNNEEQIEIEKRNKEETSDVDNLQQEHKVVNKGGDVEVEILLARMAAKRNVLAGSKRSVGVAEESARLGVLRRENPKYFLRNYEGVKSKLEYFSRTAEESPSTRQSFNLYPERASSDRRKVKSWAEHFERRSLDTHASYEPVYANFKTISATKNQPALTSKIEKKPLPVPRSKNQGGQSVESLDRSEPVVKNDECLKETKMSDFKNFSASKTENVPQEIPSSEVGPAGKFEMPEVPEHYETPQLLLEGTTKPIEEEEKQKKKVLGIKKSEKFLGKMQLPSEENVKFNKDEREDLASGADYSFSSIAVAGKSEQLDITKHTDDDEMEEIDNNNESTLNLFHLEASSYDESYLSLFKSPEDKVYEDISGQRKPRGYFNIAYLGEVSDGESLEDLSRHGMDNAKHLKDNESKPRIIDFVPLDDATEPVFNKHNLLLPDYNTLEREKTYHVLNTAATSAKVRKSVSKIEEAKESTLSLPSVPSGSRTSFSAAKKVFEALLEANVDTAKIKKKKLKKKDLLLDKSDGDEVGSSVSSLELVEGEKIAKADN